MSPRLIRYYGITVMIILALLIVEALCSQHAHAKERFTYDINVLSANVARAVMIYKPDTHGTQDVLKLFGTLETKDNWDRIYSVHHKVASIIAPNDFPILSEMELDKNKKKKFYTLYFGPEGIAGLKRAEGKKEKLISEQTALRTHDLLSWVNYLRTFELKLGKPFNFRIFSGNRFYKVTAVPTKIEDVWVRSGLIPAYKIEASISSFRKRKKFNKKAEVWIGADEEKLPLQMIFNLTLGEIRVILTDIK